jgi:hypothetical protein
MFKSNLYRPQEVIQSAGTTLHKIEVISSNLRSPSCGHVKKKKKKKKSLSLSSLS